MNFKGSMRRLSAGCAASAAGSPRRGGCSPSSAWPCRSSGRRSSGHATDLIFAGVVGEQLPAGATKAQAVDAAAGRRAGHASPTWSPRWTSAGAGHRLRRRRPGAARCPRAVCRRVGALLAPGPASRRSSCSGRSTSCAARSRTKLTRLPLTYFDHSRAARCSAGSPTTSTTSPRRCSRR